MNDIEIRIIKMLQQEEAIPEKDDAGIITAKGIDSQVRQQAIKDCLKIVREENELNGCS